MSTSTAIIQRSAIAFGTSGARGLVEQFTSEVCGAYTQAFVQVMKASYQFDAIAIGIDNRPSSINMAKYCASTAQQNGLKVYFYGVLPTPALAYMSMQQKIPAIMVTGSHIPFDRNGLKFYRPDGEITKADELAITEMDCCFQYDFLQPEWAESEDAKKQYQDRYLSLFDTPFLSGKRIGIYEHSSAGRELYGNVFKSLGAEVISLGRSDSFVPIDTEAVSEEDAHRAHHWSREHRLDALFSTDGDGDRPMLTDEEGNWLKGDTLCLLAAKALDIQALAVPVSCNTAIETSRVSEFVQRTRIGSPYVISTFTELSGQYDSVAGFEANGGFLLATDVQVNGKLLKALPTRDALLPVLMVLWAARESSIRQLCADLPERYTASNRLQNFPQSHSDRLLSLGQKSPEYLLKLLKLDAYEIKDINVTDGLRMTLSNADIVHLRPSGNAPEFRCYTESGDAERATSLVAEVLKQIALLDMGNL